MSKGNSRRNKRSKVTTQSIEKRNVIFDFSFLTSWVSSESGNVFSSYLKDSDQFFRSNYIVMKIMLPKINDVEFHNENQFLKCLSDLGFRHTHAMGDEKLKIFKDVLSASYLNVTKCDKATAYKTIEQNIDGKKIYQIGFQSIRIFGYFKDNIFTVLLVDYHHLIYPDVKHNEADFMSYKFCPIQVGC